MFPRRIVQKAQRAAREIRNEGFSFPKFLGKEGWKKKEISGVCMEIYISPCKKYVLKCNNIMSKGGRGMKYRIPTKVIKIGNSTWRLQPKAVTGSKARRAALERLQSQEKDLPDICEENVGMFKKQPVMLDW